MQDRLYRQQIISDPEGSRAQAALDYIRNPKNVYSQSVLQKIQDGDYEGARQIELYNYINGDE